MTDIITVRGYVATEVRLTLAQSGLPIAGFRMCATERRFDRASNAWVDGHTNWYSVSMFRQLATNAGASIKKGDRVIVTGRLRIRPWINADGRTGTAVEIDADSAGHDLMWGTANFRRTAADRSDTLGDADGGPEGASTEEEIPEGVNAETGELHDAPASDEVHSGAGEPTSEDEGAGGRRNRTRSEDLEEAAVPF